jgi:long-subunit fatty acid transport protein
VEYRVNKFTIRFGTRVYYSYTYNKEWDNNTILKQQIRHAINYNYSFGLGWQPSDNFVIDLGYKRSYYGFDIGDWSIYLKYLF